MPTKSAVEKLRQCASYRHLGAKAGGVAIIVPVVEGVAKHVASRNAGRDGPATTGPLRIPSKFRFAMTRALIMGKL